MQQANFLFSKNKHLYAAAFLTPVLILLAVMAGSMVWPLGDKCILRTDMYHQYAPFFSELREKLQNGGSLKFTWNLGLGVNFIAIIAYYLASPLNLAVALVDPDHVIEFMTLLVLIKTGLSGITMAAYLRHRAPANGFAAYLFSLFYALSGYACAYYWNLMWFDAIALFPLVMLGTEKLLRGECGILYGISLGLCIFTNYYIAMLMCIFLVMYFFAFQILEHPENWKAFVKNGLRFAFWSLLAGGLAAVLLLPEIAAFKATASSSNTFPKSAHSYFAIIDMLARHLPMVETEQGLDHWPNIYCGTLAIPLLLLYFRSKEIALKEKAVYVVLCLIFLAAFSIDVLNFMWHGMHYPNSLPARQSFIYIFLVLFMGFRVFDHIRSFSRKDAGWAFGGSMAFLLIVQQTVDDDAIAFWVYYVAMAVLALYGLVFYLWRRKLLTRSAAAMGVFFVVLAEVSANTAYTSITTTSRTDFMADNNDIRILVDAAARSEDGGFFRVERAKRKSKDDGAWLNFPSASIFSSMANASVTKFYKHIGCESSANAYCITGSTPLVDLLFGINYELLNNESNEAEGMRFMEQSGDVYLHWNAYALSPGFMMPQRMVSEWMTDMDKPVNVQNSLCDALHTQQLLMPVYSDVSQSGGEFSITLSENGRYYAFENKTKAGDVTVRWGDKKKTFNNLDRGYFMELGECTRGTMVHFKTEKTDVDPDITLYRVNEEALDEIYNALKDYQLQISAYGDDFIRGTIICDPEDLGYSGANGKMILTTPFDEGWTVLIDGEKAGTFRAFDTFLGVYVPGGLHDIEFIYQPKWLKEGAVISGVSLAVLLLTCLMAYRRKRFAVEPDAETQVTESSEAPEESNS